MFKRVQKCKKTFNKKVRVCTKDVPLLSAAVELLRLGNIRFRLLLQIPASERLERTKLHTKLPVIGDEMSGFEGAAGAGGGEAEGEAQDALVSSGTF